MQDTLDPKNSKISWIVHIIQHYNPKRYWNFRAKVIDKSCKYPRFLKLLMLFYIKYCDAYNNASMGTNLNCGASFLSPPYLPHGLNGIIVHNDAIIGKKCTILHQVTIAGKHGKAPIIGDNVIIGAGAKILGGVRVGNNVIIGANTVVTKDIPDNKIVVGASMRIL